MDIFQDIDNFFKALDEAKIKVEKEFSLFAGCKKNGLTDVNLREICDDPDCTVCRTFENGFKKLVMGWREKHKRINLSKIENKWRKT